MTRMLTVTALLLFLVPGVAVADDQTEANDLLAKVLKAHGGEAALGKIVAFRVKVKGTDYEGDKQAATSSEITCQGYDKSMTVNVSGDTKTESIEVVNGNDGWVKNGDKETEKLSDELMKLRREGCYVNWITTVFPFKEKAFKLSVLDETSVAGHKAVGLLVQHDKYEPVKLYFDKKTLLFVKYTREFQNVEAGAKVTEEVVYSNYKTVQGIQQPFKLVTYWNGTKVEDIEVVELKMFEKPVDERLFTKP